MPFSFRICYITGDLYLAAKTDENALISSWGDPLVAGSERCWDKYSAEAANLAFMPSEDCFGNQIECAVGDQILFETDSMVAESYPAQLSKPYSVRVMGHLPDEEVQAIASAIDLNI